MTAELSDTALRAMLPDGAWRILRMKDGSLLAICPEHPPHVVNLDGEVTVLSGLGAPASFKVQDTPNDRTPQG